MLGDICHSGICIFGRFACPRSGICPPSKIYKPGILVKRASKNVWGKKYPITLATMAIYVYVYVCIYMHIYTYTRTHIYTQKWPRYAKLMPATVFFFVQKIAGNMKKMSSKFRPFSMSAG